MQRFRTCSVAMAIATAAAIATAPALAQKVLTGQAAFTDYTKEHPGVRRHLTVADLPAPYATKGADNGAEMVERPNDAWPQAPQGFKVELYTTGLDQPRLIRTAPNGDLFVALSYQNKIMVFRGVNADGKPKEVSTFADGLSQPFGIQFYPAKDPKWVYIGNTDSVVRFPYHAATSRRAGPRKSWPICPGADACAEAVTGPATSRFRRTASGCSSRSAPIPTMTIPTPIPRRRTVPMSSSSPLKESS